MSGVIAYLLGLAMFGAAVVGTILFVLPGFLGLIAGHPWSVGGAFAWWLGWLGVVSGWRGVLAESALLPALPYLIACGILAACFVSIYRTVNRPTTERHPILPERLRRTGR